MMDMPSDEQLLALFKKHTNPTGTAHTPIPWKLPLHYQQDETLKYCIEAEEGADGRGGYIGCFARKEDRDLALYFANAHAGMIAVIRSLSEAFRFLATGTDDLATARFASDAAERARIYADLFARMGKIEGEQTDG